MELNQIINADCLEFMQTMPDKSVDLVLTDPPYFKIVKNEWDNQWSDIFEFQEWCGKIADELKRIMKDNASLYWFGDDKTIAYVQTELDKRFNLLNSIVWRKNGLQTFKGVTVFRSFAPITERILFYDKGEDKSGLTMLFSNPDLFSSIKKYMRDEKAKLMESRGFTTEKQFAEYISHILSSLVRTAAPSMVNQSRPSPKRFFANISCGRLGSTTGFGFPASVSGAVSSSRRMQVPATVSSVPTQLLTA